VNSKNNLKFQLGKTCILIATPLNRELLQSLPIPKAKLSTYYYRDPYKGFPFQGPLYGGAKCLVVVTLYHHTCEEAQAFGSGCCCICERSWRLETRERERVGDGNLPKGSTTWGSKLLEDPFFVLGSEGMGEKRRACCCCCCCCC